MLRPNPDGSGVTDGAVDRNALIKTYIGLDLKPGIDDVDQIVAAVDEVSLRFAENLRDVLPIPGLSSRLARSPREWRAANELRSDGIYITQAIMCLGRLGEGERTQAAVARWLRLLVQEPRVGAYNVLDIVAHGIHVPDDVLVQMTSSGDGDVRTRAWVALGKDGAVRSSETVPVGGVRRI